MEDCIIISDDEDNIEIIQYVVSEKPYVIDLERENSRYQAKKPPETTIHKPPPARPQAPPSQPQAPSSQPQAPPSPPTPPSPSPSPSPSPTPRPSSPSPPSKQQDPPQPPRQPEPPKPSKVERTSRHPDPPDPPQPQRRQDTPQPLHSTRQPEPPQSSKVQQPPKQPELSKPFEPPEPKRDSQEASVPTISDYDLMMSQKALGNEKYKQNLFDDAIRVYRRANELAKKLNNREMSAILHFNLAMTYYRLGSFDQAADECANAVRFDDKYSKAHLKRAEIYQRQGKFDEAVICYEHILELDSTNQDYAILLYHAREAAKRVKKKDYYQLLGLRYNFTHEDLKKAYRQNALSHHPDRHSDADIVSRRIHEKRFKDASEAHSALQLRLGL